MGSYSLLVVSIPYLLWNFWNRDRKKRIIFGQFNNMRFFISYNMWYGNILLAADRKSIPPFTIWFHNHGYYFLFTDNKAESCAINSTELHNILPKFWLHLFWSNKTLHINSAFLVSIVKLSSLTIFYSFQLLVLI